MAISKIPGKGTQNLFNNISDAGTEGTKVATGTTAQKPQSHEYLTIYWHFIQRRQSAHSHHRYVSCNHLYTYTHIIIFDILSKI